MIPGFLSRRITVPSKKQKKSSDKLFQLKITLTGSPLPVWRRVVVRAGAPLELVHEVFQIVMGWSNTHLHVFHVDDRAITDADTANATPAGKKGPRYEDEADLDLQDIISKKDDSFVYEYDMGDGWNHEVVLEQIIEQEEAGSFLAHCLSGKRACPPEDVGGIAGYANFIDALEDSEHPEHEDMLNWIGCSFDPDSFDARLVNLRIAQFEQDFSNKFKEALESVLLKN